MFLLHFYLAFIEVVLEVATLTTHNAPGAAHHTKQNQSYFSKHALSVEMHTMCGQGLCIKVVINSSLKSVLVDVTTHFKKIKCK